MQALLHPPTPTCLTLVLERLIGRRNDDNPRLVSGIVRPLERLTAVVDVVEVIETVHRILVFNLTSVPLLLVELLAVWVLQLTVFNP